MKRATLTIALLGLATACFAQSAEGSLSLVLNPWVTLALLSAGMILLISQLMSLSAWGWSGTAGVACLGAVIASYSLAGVLAWTAAILLIAGIGLLLLESRVFAGYGISGIAGLICLSVGLYSMLAAAGTLFAALAATFVTILAAIAFLVHLPQNPKWQMIGRKLDITMGRPHSMIGGTVDITGTGKAQIKHTPHVKPAKSEESEDQQIIQREE